MVDASTYVLLTVVLPFETPLPWLPTSSSERKGPEVPRFRLRPVRFGTVTLSRRLFVWAQRDGYEFLELIVTLGVGRGFQSRSQALRRLLVSPKAVGTAISADLAQFDRPT